MLLHIRGAWHRKDCHCDGGHALSAGVCLQIRDTFDIVLQEASDEYPDFNFYSMNGMRLTCPDQACPFIFNGIVSITKLKSTPFVKT